MVVSGIERNTIDATLPRKHAHSMRGGMFGLFKSPLKQILELLPKSEEAEFWRIVDLVSSLIPGHSDVQKTRICAAVTSVYFHRKAINGDVSIRQKDCDKIKIIGTNSYRFLNDEDKIIAEGIVKLYFSDQSN